MVEPRRDRFFSADSSAWASANFPATRSTAGSDSASSFGAYAIRRKVSHEGVAADPGADDPDGGSGPEFSMPAFFHTPSPCAQDRRNVIGMTPRDPKWEYRFDNSHHRQMLAASSSARSSGTGSLPPGWAWEYSSAASVIATVSAVMIGPTELCRSLDSR